MQVASDILPLPLTSEENGAHTFVKITKNITEHLDIIKKFMLKMRLINLDVKTSYMF